MHNFEHSKVEWARSTAGMFFDGSPTCNIVICCERYVRFFDFGVCEVFQPLPGPCVLHYPLRVQLPFEDRFPCLVVVIRDSLSEFPLSDGALVCGFQYRKLGSRYQC